MLGYATLTKSTLHIRFNGKVAVMGRPSLSPAEAADRIRTRPAVGLSVAAAALDVSQAHASRLVAAGKFPVPVIRMGSRVVVPTAGLRTVLSLDEPTHQGGAA